MLSFWVCFFWLPRKCRTRRRIFNWPFCGMTLSHGWVFWVSFVLLWFCGIGFCLDVRTCMGSYCFWTVSGLFEDYVRDPVQPLFGC